MANHDITLSNMREEFTKYDVSKAVEKFGLKSDESYVFISMLGRDYRIARDSGLVEWSADGFVSDVHEGDFRESMTLYDLLCYSSDDCCLAGELCGVDSLNKLAQSTSTNTFGSLYQEHANRFSDEIDAFERALLEIGEAAKLPGDVSAMLRPFSFDFPVAVQLWEGDDEFEANLKFMFDKNTISYMHYETVFYLMGHIIFRIREAMGIEE